MKMKKIWYGFLFATMVMVFVGNSASAASSDSSGPMLKMIQIEVDSPSDVKKLAGMGIDIASVKKTDTKDDLSQTSIRVEAVVSKHDQKKLEKAGFKWNDLINRAAKKQMLRATTESVYHSFDEPTLGIKDQLYKIAETYPDITDLEVIGYSTKDRPMIAMHITNEASPFFKKKKEVLFLATHHAREWMATQMAMRLINHLTQSYGIDTRITTLLDTTNIWIVPVANPDGYEYTFTDERLWRKNLSDNDGDGEITLADGVDLNRNFETHWGLDDEGSSPDIQDQTYRGTGPNSEPETQVVVDFIKNHKFKFIISYHTYSNLILYPWGWQVKTPSFDDPIFIAQAGTDDNPAIWDSILNVGYDPGVSADLYPTNGDFTDWCYGGQGIPAYTVELTMGEDQDGNPYGFEFPDDESMVQTVFEDNLNFALCIAESAKTPSKPVSPVGIDIENVYHTPVTASYGEDQAIEVLVRKWRYPILKYSINDGSWRYAWFKKVKGKFYNTEPGTYFTRYRAIIPGQNQGDVVKYKIRARKDEVGPFSYSVEKASGSKVLIVSAEDYTGIYPSYNPEDPDSPPPAPIYLHYYTEALEAAGYLYDVWDVTAKESAPPTLEVLSHYDAVIWYTGDDYMPTVPGFDVHADLYFTFRNYLNYYDGKLLATGQDLANPSTFYAMYSDDFFQYYLGSQIQIQEGGINPDTNEPFLVEGEENDPIFDGLSFAISNGTGANNQQSPDTFLATSYFLPHFDNTIAAHYVRPGGPSFDPHSGDYYIYSQKADSAYKRLGGSFTLPQVDDLNLKFWISYDIEADWDYAFVEIYDKQTGLWTTLPEVNGLTSDEGGESCAAGWTEAIHPHLAYYTTFENGTCESQGTTGSWNALTGNSGGWKQVEFNLSEYAGKEVEIYISYVTDWGTQGFGIFIDDVELSGFDTNDFEAGFDMWEVSSAPENTPFNNWDRITGLGIPEGPALRSSDTVYLGFGFEAIDTLETRTLIMDRIMRYLNQN
ncbi:MAG: zinc carboxypeptidase [Desulfobacteraceae bacterium]|nr:zinc carboxypeptidase [Desulfobacteraceae bacterium]